MLPQETVIPPVDAAALPPEVREGTAQDRELYATALGFERMLVEELTRQMTDSLAALDGGDGEDDHDDGGLSLSSASLLTDQLPSTLADAIASGGGLGLALDLWRALRPETSASQPLQSGAAPAAQQAQQDPSAPSGAQESA